MRLPHAARHCLVRAALPSAAVVLGIACQGARPSDLFEEGAEGGASTGGSTAGTTAGTTSGATTGSATGGATAGSTTGSTAGSTTGSTTGGSVACTAGGAPCPAGQVCRATGCTNGVCVTLAGGADAYAPVCGCNGLTYWNGNIAGGRNIAVRGAGACEGNRAIACGGITSTACPEGSACSRPAQSQTACAAAVEGVCWVLPASCGSGAGIGPSRRRCLGGSQACQPVCKLIEGDDPYWDDPSCPNR